MEFLAALASGAVLLAAGGLAFVAYHHPKQFRVAAKTAIALMVVLQIGWWGASAQRQITRAQIEQSSLPSDTKEAVLETLKSASKRTEQQRWTYYGIWSTFWYILALSTLPLWGLTAQDREASRREALPRSDGRYRSR